MPQPEDWGSRSVEIQDHDSDSMLSLYRQALSCRIDMVKQGEEVHFIGDGTDGLFSFTRGSYAVVVNTSEDAVEIPQEIMAGRGLILGSQTGVFSAVEEASYIAANSAVWLG